ncbi:MAG UNVERIFIED_CONTAM: phosphatidylinositol-specific phospholipase C1-like protein [Planctomycetaceae bacterium]|jgi:hypothetical protein
MVQLATVRCRILLLSLLSFFPAAATADDLRLHQIQVIGTHNSYHIEPAAGLKPFIRSAGVSLLQSIEYTHRPLPEQLSQLCVRQLELDIYADPVGGLFAKPLGRALALAAGADPGDDPNADSLLSQPGFKVLHAPGFDYATRTPTLSSAFEQIRTWSKANPGHLPVMILLELKEVAPGPSGVQPVKFTASLLRELHQLIAHTFPQEACLTPQDLCEPGDSCVRNAVLSRGWPKVSAVRGRVFFCLDNEGGWVDRWLEAMNEIQQPRVFVSVSPEHPQAAWLKRNDPVSQFSEIQRLVRQNFLIRTRADADTSESRSGETARRERALASGAQYISTDFPEADARFTDYAVRWPEGAAGRRNPVSLPAAAINTGADENWLREPH